MYCIITIPHWKNAAFAATCSLDIDLRRQFLFPFHLEPNRQVLQIPDTSTVMIVESVAKRGNLAAGSLPSSERRGAVN